MGCAQLRVLSLGEREGDRGSERKRKRESEREREIVRKTVRERWEGEGEGESKRTAVDMIKDTAVNELVRKMTDLIFLFQLFHLLPGNILHPPIITTVTNKSCNGG